MRTHLLLGVLLAGAPGARAADTTHDARETVERVKERLEQGPPPDASPGTKKAHEEALESAKGALKSLDALDATMKKFSEGLGDHKIYAVMERREDKGPVLLVHRMAEPFEPHSEVMVDSDKDKAKAAALIDALVGESSATVKVETLDERFARERPAAATEKKPELVKYDKEHKAKLKADLKGRFAVVYRYRKPEAPAPAPAEAKARKD